MKKIFLIAIIVCSSLSAFSQSQYRYYKAQMHCHSTNSDGVFSPQEVGQLYKDRGYEILFLTDHNFMTPYTDINIPGLLVINSEEYTFSKHINGFFLNHSVDAHSYKPQQAIDSIKSQGGISQFNHPINTVAGGEWAYSFTEFMALNNLDIIEIHNTGTDILQAYFDLSIWDNLLSNGRKIWGTATDDMHKLTEYMIPTINNGWIMVKLCTLSEDSVFSAIKRGDFYGSKGIVISEYSVCGSKISISSPNATKIRFVGAWGENLKEVNGKIASYKRTTEKYIRVELEDDGTFGVDKKIAWTQPVFFDDNFVNVDCDKDVLMSEVFEAMPNPANEKCVIKYDVKNEGKVTVKLYDIKGKVILKIADANLSKGLYSQIIDLNNYKAGFYYCQLVNETYIKTIKISVIK